MNSERISVGDTITAVGTAKDVGASDTLNVYWDFGEGKILAIPNVKSPFTRTHQYGATGTFPVTLRVMDDDGGTCEAPALPVTVGKERRRLASLKKMRTLHE